MSDEQDDEPLTLEFMIRYELLDMRKPGAPKADVTDAEISAMAESLQLAGADDSAEEAKAEHEAGIQALGKLSKMGLTAAAIRAGGFPGGDLNASKLEQLVDWAKTAEAKATKAQVKTSKPQRKRERAERIYWAAVPIFERIAQRPATTITDHATGQEYGGFALFLNNLFALFGVKRDAEGLIKEMPPRGGYRPRVKK